MGNDMRMYGASLRLRDQTDEAQLVALAREVLTGPGAGVHAYVDVQALRSATTLEQLFAAYDLAVCRRDGDVVACFARDGRYNAPQDLFAAIAPAVVDGSWVACGTDYTGTLVVVFDSGASTTHWLFDGSVHEWEWAPGYPTAPQADKDRELTALVGTLTGRTDLLTGHAAPREASPEHDRLDECIARADTWLIPPAA